MPAPTSAEVMERTEKSRKLLESLYSKRESVVLQQLEVLTQNHWPRELGFRLPSNRFTRNVYVPDPSVNEPPASQVMNVVRFHRWTDCFMSVYSFEGEYQEGKMWPRDRTYVDRLFFDLDCKEDPDRALQDTKKLVDYLRKRGCVPLVLFTGTKGFHVHVPFTPFKLSPIISSCPVKNKDVVYEAAKSGLRFFVELLTEKLELETADLQTAGYERLCRIPFTINASSGNICVPVSLKTLDSTETVEEIVRRTEKGHFEVVRALYKKEFGKRLMDALYSTVSSEVAELVEREKERERAKADAKVLDAIRDRGLLTKLPLKKDPFAALVAAKWKATNILLKKYGMKVPDYVPYRVYVYSKELERLGWLRESEYVRRVHSNCKFVKGQDFNPGAVELAARVHLVCCMLRIGFSEQEILDVFRKAEKFDVKKTSYHIRYNLKRMLEEGEIVAEVYAKVASMGPKELRALISQERKK